MIIVLTPLPEEFDGFVAGCAKRRLPVEARQIGRLPAHYYPSLGVMLVRGGHGKTQFGIHTQHVLDHVAFSANQPADKDLLVICAGAAGALAEGLQVGDVVVATETVEHDYNLKFVRRPLPRFVGDATSIAVMRLLSPVNFTLHFGVVASGDEDVIEVTRGVDLRERTGGIAVAWEGVGGARACKFNHVRFLELRGITDTANHDAPADFETNLALVMDNLVEVLSAECKVESKK